MITRHFLGWDKPLLEAACDWLLAASPDAGMDSQVIIVSGARAGRRLLQLLAARCSDEGLLLVPPRIVPAGKALRELFEQPPDLFPPASPLTCTLAWVAAFDELAEPEARLPGFQDDAGFTAGGLKQAGMLAKTCEELGAHLLSPADVLPVLKRSENATEHTLNRWKTVQAAHDKYLATLKKWGCSDPTKFQIDLANTAVPKQDKQVVLLGLAEFYPMVARGLARLENPIVSLIYAPENEGEFFDGSGRIIPEKWTTRKVPLACGEVRCVENAEEQASAVAELACQWTRSEDRPAWVITASDEKNDTPLLCDAFAEKGRVARPAGIKEFRATRPWQVLRLLGEYLDHPVDRFPAFSIVAQIARHPDFARRLDSTKIIRTLDDWHEEHLPKYFDPENDAYANKEPELTAFIGRLEALVNITPEVGKMSELAGRVSGFLEAIFGSLTEKADSPRGRALIRPLEALLEELDACSGAAPGLRLAPSVFIKALLESCGNKNVPATFEREAVDIVGWLELLADDSPAAVITSLCEGLVPASITSDSLLPGRLREQLKLNHDAARLGRDIYLLTAVAQQRRGRLAVFVPRKNADGDPLRPSRLLLAGLEGEELARRLIHLTTHKETQPPGIHTVPAGRMMAEMPVVQPVEKLSVSAFRDYLASPRLFYFKHVLRLNTVEDGSTEMDERLQGTLVHAVCAAFGNWEIKESASEREIRDWVLKKLDDEVRGRFAGLEPGIVKFQIESLRTRLRAFAKVQAEERRAGWKIVYAENAADHSEKLECQLNAENGNPLKIRGRIDRVDHHEQTGEWRVMDYKTGGKATTPDAAHFKRSKTGDVMWSDLQLPLYSLLFEKLAERIPGLDKRIHPQLCYFLLPDDPGETAVSEPFDPAMIDRGIEEAKAVARKICAGEFQETGKIRANEDPVYRALCGLAGWVESEPEEEAVS